MRFRTAVILACAFILKSADKPPDFRLPGMVRPERYQLDLTLRPEQPSFHGEVVIDIRLTAATQVIWLNGKDLTVESAWIQQGAGRKPVRTRVEAGEFIALELDQPVGPGQAAIGLTFKGKLDEKASVGVYRRSDGQHWYAFTAFTAIDARRAFPCFDEPEFKTPWRVVLRVPQDDVAVANSRMVSETREAGGLKRVIFDETKPIATEVVAFGVGPFDVVEDGTAGRNHIPVRIIAPHGRGSEADGARGASKTIVERLEAYTGFPYMWDKLDHMALLDMPFGAIENPGLITYRDRVLLAPPRRDTAERRQAMRGTMAHELAHQWFGNLVTQRWWNDVWLSEGFASWLGGKISDLELPESQRGIAGVESRARIMNTDSRPVRLEMHSRKEMGDIYSQIVYQKGAGVLRMVEHWLGEEPFQKGLQRYLKEHAYGSATTADLAAALKAESGVDVSGVFDSFLNQPGFPVVKATMDCAEKRIRVRQESSLKWRTPVCAGATCRVIAEEGEIPIEECPVWPNAGGTGYYRVDLSDWAGMLEKNWESLTAPERLAIAEDSARLPAQQQLAALPLLLRDRDSHVVAAGQKMAIKLMGNAEYRDKVAEIAAASGRRRR